MGAKTKIEWADATWGPIRGCSRVSAGCVHCYAETMAARFSGPGQPYDGLIRDRKWSGVVRLIPERLEDPIRWQKPRRIFVNSMSDLFHEELTDATIDRVFDVMERAPRHTFQVLTKRPHRSLSYTARRYVRGPAHVWIGTSIEDQKACGERLESIRDTAAGVRFVSAEPLLGPIDFGFRGGGESVGWVIVGGESGPGARRCDIRWIDKIVHQCENARIPVFVKQLGANVTIDGRPVKLKHPKGGDGDEWPEIGEGEEFGWFVRKFPVSR